MLTGILKEYSKMKKTFEQWIETLKKLCIRIKIKYGNLEYKNLTEVIK